MQAQSASHVSLNYPHTYLQGTFHLTQPHPQKRQHTTMTVVQARNTGFGKLVQQQLNFLPPCFILNVLCPEFHNFLNLNQTLKLRGVYGQVVEGLSSKLEGSGPETADFPSNSSRQATNALVSLFTEQRELVPASYQLGTS